MFTTHYAPLKKFIFAMLRRIRNSLPQKCDTEIQHIYYIVGKYLIAATNYVIVVPGSQTVETVPPTWELYVDYTDICGILG